MEALADRRIFHAINGGSPPFFVPIVIIERKGENEAPWKPERGATRSYDPGHYRRHNERDSPGELCDGVFRCRCTVRQAHPSGPTRP